MYSEKIHITYYQWIPFILALIALFYYLPYLVWKNIMKSLTSFNVPIDVSGLIQLLKDTRLYKTKDLNQAIAQVTQYLHNCFVQNSDEFKYAIKHGLIDYDFENGESSV
jgi:hypothetical protein